MLRLPFDPTAQGWRVIINSTIGSLTLRTDGGEHIVFPGEWTLEPKFYLSKKNIHRRDGVGKLSIGELSKFLNQLLHEADERHWHIVVED